MATQEEWRQHRYQQDLGRDGISTGTMANAEALQTYHAEVARTNQMWKDTSALVQTHTPAPTPVTPIARPPQHSTSNLGAVAGGNGSSFRIGATTTRQLSPIERILQPFSDALEISDLEDFWDVSGPLFGPLRKITPNWLVYTVCISSSLLFAALPLAQGQDGAIAILLLGVVGFFAPVILYAAIRLLVSCAILALALTVVVAFYGLMLAAAGATIFGVFWVIAFLLA
ncbi:hypothetical protein [Hoeflea sp. TYP-13]|uniref:hypothetical protein n=1 Tax=Hoeflea sp. TYP-13 TaxID=3230023 RepID=UPI0034C6680D